MPLDRHKMERSLLLCLKASILCLLFLSFILIFFLALSFDESWLLSRYMEIYNYSEFPWKMAPMSLTNGGIYILAGALLYTVFGLHIWIFRLFSFISLLIILFIIGRWTKASFSSKAAPLIVFAVFLGLPGAVELGASAYAEMTAMLFLILGLNALLDFDLSKGSKRTLVLSGIFFGFAASSRLNLILIFPVILLDFLFCKEERDRRFWQGFLIVFSGVAAYVIAQGFLILVSPHPASEMFEKSIEFSGFKFYLFDYPGILNKWVVANGFIPLYLMIPISLFAMLNGSKHARVLRILVVFGWVHWFFWLTRAPIAHLRYLWPTIASFAIVGGIGLAFLYQKAKESDRHLYPHAVIAAACGFTFLEMGLAFREMIHGDGNILSWEWSGEAPLTDFRRFHYALDQHRMAEYLRTHAGKDEAVGVAGVNLEIELLSGVKTISYDYYINHDNWTNLPLPGRILMTPTIGHYLYMDPAFSLWMEKNLKKEAQFGNYVLYQVIGKYPEQPDFFKFYHSPHPSFPLADPFF